MLVNVKVTGGLRDHKMAVSWQKKLLFRSNLILKSLPKTGSVKLSDGLWTWNHMSASGMTNILRMYWSSCSNKYCLL